MRRKSPGVLPVNVREHIYALVPTVFAIAGIGFGIVLVAAALKGTK